MSAKKIEYVQRNIVRVLSAITIDKEINDSTEREAMGLPDNLVDYYSELFSELFDSFEFKNRKALVSILDSPSSHIFERICAGNLLAYLGDPRIQKIPTMLKLHGGDARIGTKSQDVDPILADVGKYGVKRSWIEKETPQYTCKLSDFCISKYPITNSQFRYFMLNSGHKTIPSSWSFGRYPQNRSNHPVYTVSDNDALAYCQWLSKVTDKKFRLPSEQEWEYAANKGSGDQYTWGDEFKLWHANTNEMLLQTTSPVGVFHEGASKFGVYDLIGNVEEYVGTKYKPHPGGSIVKDDLYLKLGCYRIAKGGAFNRFKDLARIARRHGPYPNSLYAMGFRVVTE